MTCFSEGIPFAIASSTFAFSGTFVPRRRPWSAVTIATHSESLTRSTIESGEKPPKITECAAPIRAHASIATGSSTIIGM
jgi:hypothetical protein